MPGAKTVVEAAGREVPVSNPDKVFFPRTGHTKIDLVRYYLAVADGALRGVHGRPMALKRFVNGAEGEPFFQKRAPDSRPDWIETVELRFPSGRTASEVVVRDAAQLVWVVNLGCIDLNPHPVRAEDLDHPDELRVDLDPVPGIEWPQIMDVAMVAKSVLEDFGLTAWPKTSGSRGFHIYARIEPRWPFTDVRRAAVALAREVERRAPDIATSKWWKEERHGVFVDYNQNAKDRTIASAYSIRPLPDARVSTPLRWDEVADCDPAAFTIDTVPARFAEVGDPWAEMDSAVGSLDGLLGLAERDEAAGVPDAPWPPHFVRQAGEEPRVQPSKRRAGRQTTASGAANAKGATAKGTAAADETRTKGAAGKGPTAKGATAKGGAEGPEDASGAATGTQRNSAGAAPVSGAAAPVSGAAAPVSGAAAPVSGAAAPVSGPAAPVSGPAAPVSGPAAPVSGPAEPVSGPAEPASAEAVPAAAKTEARAEDDGTGTVSRSPTGRRQSKMPLIEVARAATKAEAMEGLERWKARHGDVWPHLAPADVLVDSMRGRSYSWTRIRLNLQHVPEAERPAQEPLEVDYDPWGPGGR
jgi:DNA ligase D-like protein (predicted polymerase)